MGDKKKSARSGPAVPDRPMPPAKVVADLAGKAAATGREARVIAEQRRMRAIRLTDAERETCVEHLAEQYALGRLQRDEWEERHDQLGRAAVHGDIPAVFQGLPMPDLYRRERDKPARWPWAVGIAVGSLSGPFLLIGLVLLALGREIGAAIFILPALIWILLSARWASRRSRRHLLPKPR
ncbi:DUF1707 SHOCT-like domain-containing protein [Kribbella deserti]|uniref:DUF1707 domain-containing protein n=1 Tax=Kribbella deserti TaxID=1926257 RepID=A0ABV6QR70_9ACTN